VCRGDGHTEAIRIEFDPEKISYETLIADVLRKGTGGACKAQYMSAVWAQDEKQKEVASKLAAQMKSTMPVLPAASWHDAEDYHQKYVQKSRR